MKINSPLLILVLICFMPIMGFGGIDFHKIDIEKAIAKAKSEGKFIFIDTYAEWCVPCKQMELVFVDQEVSDFFNDHFINVKIDMDSPLGKKISEDYDIVWLPTLVFLDQEGQVRSKIDKLVDGTELISLARQAMSTAAIASTQEYYSDPFTHSGTKSADNTTANTKIITEDDAPIIYVYDERASSGRPHIMYHEAYLHLQLMDGKQYQVARKYLSTQKDWTTEKNVKFIFDFLRTTNSPEFLFFVDHQPLFIEMFGQQKVQRTIEILVQQRLEKGYPRPGLEETIRLFSFIDKQTAVQNAYAHVIHRLDEEKKYVELRRMATDYLNNINSYDTQIMNTYVSAVLTSGIVDQRELENAYHWAIEATIFNSSDWKSQYLLAQLYEKKNDIVNANSTGQLARQLAANAANADEIEELDSFLSRIKM